MEFITGGELLPIEAHMDGIVTFGQANAADPDMVRAGVHEIDFEIELGTQRGIIGVVACLRVGSGLKGPVAGESARNGRRPAMTALRRVRMSVFGFKGNEAISSRILLELSPRYVKRGEDDPGLIHGYHTGAGPTAPGATPPGKL